MLRIRYVGKALPKYNGLEGNVIDTSAIYYFVRFDHMTHGSVAINKQNVEYV